MGAVDVERVHAAGLRRWCRRARGRAVAPVDHGREVVSGRRRVGVGEAADDGEPENACRCCGVKATAAPAVSGASAMTACEAPATVIGVVPLLSVTATTTWYVPSSGSVMAGALTVYWAELPFWVMLAAGTETDESRRPSR